jgi:penicillin G amidase
MKLQNSYYNLLASDVRPILLKFVDESKLTGEEKKFLQLVKDWDLMAGPDSKGQTVYQCWWDSLQAGIWRDDLSRINPAAPWPTGQNTMELLQKDTALRFIDDINTPEKETLHDQVTNALQRSVLVLSKSEGEGKLEWAKFKNPTVYHLLKNALLPFARAGLPVGGNGDIINAVTHSHGPSWRMVVSLSPETEAYGVYPGGQSGNPGSRFYDDFIDHWSGGKYFRLWVMKREESADKRVRGRISFARLL